LSLLRVPDERNAPETPSTRRRAIGRARDDSSSSRSRSRSPKKRRGRFRRGDAVEARPDGEDDYEGAKVSKVHDDGKTYDLTFDDGRKLRRVKERKIRSLDSGSEDDRRARRKDKGSDDERRKERKRYERRDSSDDEASFREGDKVEAKVGGRSRRPGKIRKAHADGTYDVEMEDGERERNVPAEHIRKAKRSKSKFSVDDRVEVKIKSKWVKGKVKRTHKDGTLDVDASNGEKARRVDSEDVRARDDGSDGDDAKIGVGDKVRAKYKGRAKEYDGVIKEAHSDGTFTIKS